MKRIIYNRLLKWKASEQRNPLLLSGVRQVGKSYILEVFGKNEFENCWVFNFEKDKKLAAIFEPDLFSERIVNELSISIGKQINIQKDLVIFDEIQECPRAITSLKYFCEDMGVLALCCAGSLLGVKLSSESFPVGKVDFLNLFPMNFEEFLMALADNHNLALIKTALHSDRQPQVAHHRLWELLKEYYVIGGMPQAVSAYVSERDNRIEAINQARTIQQGLVDSYFKDFSKHSGKTNAMHIVSVFENAPMQLAMNRDGSVKRYRFKDVIPRKKSFAELQGPIEWLEKAGLVIKVKICNKSEIPLEAFCKKNIFKLYLFDIGVLGCMLELPVRSIITHDFGMTKGYLAENYVVQEFTASGNSKLYAWNERNSEIEFLRILKGKIIPIEVKSGIRTQSKSLKQYLKKYAPAKAIKLTGNPLNRGGNQVIHNYPLYLSGWI